MISHWSLFHFLLIKESGRKLRYYAGSRPIANKVVGVYHILASFISFPENVPYDFPETTPFL